MQIILHNIDMNTPQPVQEGAGIGYWCDFESSLARGKALFVPLGTPLEARVGIPLVVRAETGPVSDIQPLPSGEPEVFQLAPLPAPGDFRAKGRTVSLVWLDDEQEDAILEVLVGEDIFSIPAGGMGDSSLEFGGWVSFLIHRLILWEREAGKG